jgi:putative ABC transport system ATP-binding protein
MLLSIRDLSMRYGEQPLFDGVALEAQAGELIAIAGESGVGKSTLLNLIAGLDRPAGGQVRIDGVDVGALDADAAARLRRRSIGFVFQAFHLLPHLTAQQNVALPLVINGDGDSENIALAMLERLGLGSLAARLPATLSGGQQQRVAIARALVHRPRLLLADEPTGNLDPAAGEAVLRLFVEQVRATGVLALVVTHSARVAALADRVLRLDRDGLHPRARPMLQQAADWP